MKACNRKTYQIKCNIEVADTVIYFQINDFLFPVENKLRLLSVIQCVFITRGCMTRTFL